MQVSFFFFLCKIQDKNFGSSVLIFSQFNSSVNHWKQKYCKYLCLYLADFMISKAVDVINTDLVNNVGNLLQRSLIDKLNPSQTYPKFYPESFRNSLLELGEPLMKSVNCLAGIISGLVFFSISCYSNHINCRIMLYK